MFEKKPTFQSNPDLRPDEENIGCAHGFTKDGTYYEAELWVWDGLLCVSFLLNEKWEFAPESEFLAKKSEEKAAEAGEFTYAPEQRDRSELTQGMLIRDDDPSHEETVRYVDYLEKMGLIEFPTDLYNGSIKALTDVCGNDVIQCLIVLETSDFGVQATTPIHFVPFEQNKAPNRPNFKVIRCGGGE